MDFMGYFTEGCKLFAKKRIIRGFRDSYAAILLVARTEAIVEYIERRVILVLISKLQFLKHCAPLIAADSERRIRSSGKPCKN